MWPFDIPRKRREAKERAARHEADLRELRRMAEKEATIRHLTQTQADRLRKVFRDENQPMRMRATPVASGTSRAEDRRQQDVGNLRRREDDPIDNAALATGSWLFDPGQSGDSEPLRHSHHCASSASDYGSTSSSSDYSCSSSNSSSSSSDSSSSYSSD